MSFWLRFRLWVGRMTEWDSIAVKALVIFFVPTLLLYGLVVFSGPISNLIGRDKSSCDAACEERIDRVIDDILKQVTPIDPDKIAKDSINEVIGTPTPVLDSAP